jgi:hypothetical protein
MKRASEKSYNRTTKIGIKEKRLTRRACMKERKRFLVGGLTLDSGPPCYLASLGRGEWKWSGCNNEGKRGSSNKNHTLSHHPSHR